MKTYEVEQQFLNVTKLAEDITVVKTPDAYRRATDCHALAKQVLKTVEDLREQTKAPIIAQGRAIDAAAKLFTVPLDKIITTMNNLRDEYKRVLAAASAPIVRPDPVAIGEIPDLSQVKPLEVVEVPFTRTRTTQVVEVIDPLLIPREYLMIDMPKLTAALKAGTAVPGAHLSSKQTYL
jgi:hypothetical protein